MTTIVYCHKTKQVAVDSRSTNGSGEILNDSSDKVLLVRDEVWFISGFWFEADSISKLKHNDKVDESYRTTAIVIKDGIAFFVGVFDGHMCFDKCDYNVGVGSGGTFAYCALDFGKTAKEAVEYAATKDCYTGGKVRVFNLDGEEVLKFQGKIPG